MSSFAGYVMPAWWAVDLCCGLGLLRNVGFLITASSPWMSFMCVGSSTGFQGEYDLLPAWIDTRLHTHRELPVSPECLLSVIYYCYQASGSVSCERRGSKWPWVV